MLSPLRVMHSVRQAGVQAGTRVSLSQLPTSPFTLAGAFRPPSTAHCVSNFNRYRSFLAAPPCRGNFKGLISNIKKGDVTQQGKPKLKFDLVDGEGTAISVIAIARNAGSPVIKDCMEVVIFNGTVRAGLGGTDGGVYLFKDALVVPIGVKKPPVSTVRRIDV